MTAHPITDAIVRKAEGLHALLLTCERAANSLNDVGDGLYRENAVAGLANTLELAAGMMDEIHTALERASLPPNGGDR